MEERRKLRFLYYFIHMKKLCKAAFKETNKMPRIFHTPETTITQNVNYTSKKSNRKRNRMDLAGVKERFFVIVCLFF